MEDNYNVSRETSIIILSSFLLSFLLLLSCNGQYQSLKSGDLLFIEADQAQLSGAISRVTNKNSTVSYDHVGLVEKNKEGLFVLHAAPVKGSVKEKLENFMKIYSSTRIDLYRIKKEYPIHIENVIYKANGLLNKPYNILYVQNEDSLYCSDFIERSFRGDHVFDLIPMTFVNPKTGTTDVYWQNLYQRYNMKVPEGEPGTNPNDLSKSIKLRKIKTLKNTKKVQ